MAFNWTQFVNAINLAPYVVAGIDEIHAEVDSTTKTQMAQDALALAAGVTGAILPGEEPIIAAASAGIGSIIAAIGNVRKAQAQGKKV